MDNLEIYAQAHAPHTVQVDKSSRKSWKNGNFNGFFTHSDPPR